MTMPVEDHEHITPIPVRIVNEEEEKSADFGIWSSYSLAGTEGAQQILPQDRKRKRAVVLVRSAVATAFVYVGSQAQCQQRTGGQLLAGTAVTIENQAALWMAPDGTNASVVSVLLEGYRAE